MFIDALMSLVTSFSRWIQGKSEQDVSQKLREQIINIIDDLVEGIAQGYLSLDSFDPVNYSREIYEHVYKDLWREYGKMRSRNASYRSEVFEFLREVPSADFSTAIRQLLQIVCWIVHIQNTGYELWARSPSVREKHIQFFKFSVDDINNRIRQNNSKYCYKLDGESVKMVRQDTGLEVPKEESGIQETDDNQNTEHHQDKSRSEIWNRRHYIIAVWVLVFTAVAVLFGTGLLIPPLHWVWDQLQRLL